IEVTQLPKGRVLSTVGGMERWGYVFVGPASAEHPPTSRRDGRGSSRGLRSDWIVRPAPAGLVGQRVWPGSFGETERRWERRFGTSMVRELRASLQSIVARVDVDLPEYVPIIASTDGLALGCSPQPRSQPHLPVALAALLAQALLAYTLDFE